MLTSTILVENNKSFIIANSTNNQDYYFIRTPGVRTEGYPVQRLFVTDKALINIINLKTNTEGNDGVLGKEITSQSSSTSQSVPSEASISLSEESISKV